MSKENPKPKSEWSDFSRIFIGMSSAFYVAQISAEGDAFSNWAKHATEKFSEQPLVHHWTLEQHVIFEQVPGTIFTFVMTFAVLLGGYEALRALISISPLPKFINRACETAKRSARQFLSFLAR